MKKARQNLQTNDRVSKSIEGSVKKKLSKSVEDDRIQKRPTSTLKQKSHTKQLSTFRKLTDKHKVSKSRYSPALGNKLFESTV